jgi:hypothetical protein
VCSTLCWLPRGLPRGPGSLIADVDAAATAATLECDHTDDALELASSILKDWAGRYTRLLVWRRAAARQELRLEKCRARDPRAIGYGTYRLVDAKGRVKAHRGDYGLTLEDIRRYLTR